MEIKKKIAVWGMLLAFLVALVPANSAKANTTETNADDVKYRDIEDLLESLGYVGFKKREDSKYLVCTNGSELWVYEHRLEGCVPFWGVDDDGYIWLFNLSGKHDCYKYCFYSLEDCAKHDKYSYYYSVVAHTEGGRYIAFEGRDDYGTKVTRPLDTVIYSDLNIYRVYVDENSYYGDMYKDETIVNIESTVGDRFDFPLWCKYAGMNALSSTNESPTKIPYSYNSYWHIVRKTSNGKWLLTTIGGTLGQAKMNLRLSEDMKSLMIYEFSGDDTVVLNVRQYEYDTDGWKVRTYGSYGYDDLTQGIVSLGDGTGIGSTRMIAYTNTAIYSADGVEVVVPISSEYYEVTIPEVPEETVTPTPTTAPSGGGSGGGSMITYKPALSGKVVADSLNMRKEASADAEILASFIKTWSLTLHGFVNDADGSVWYFCTAERDGNTYTGYVLSDYVEIVGGSSSSGSESDGTLDDKLAEALTELESLALFVARVPLIIGIIFSFMPSWCLVLLGFAFGFLVLKAITSK